VGIEAYIFCDNGISEQEKYSRGLFIFLKIMRRVILVKFCYKLEIISFVGNRLRGMSLWRLRGKENKREKSQHCSIYIWKMLQCALSLISTTTISKLCIQLTLKHLFLNFSFTLTLFFF
jgi:hypothetical protein